MWPTAAQDHPHGHKTSAYGKQITERNEGWLSRRHSLLQDLAVGGLWEAEVVQLVQQLVHDDEVVPQTLLLQLLEVVLKHLPRPEGKCESLSLGSAARQEHREGIPQFFPAGEISHRSAGVGAAADNGVSAAPAWPDGPTGQS